LCDQRSLILDQPYDKHPDHESTIILCCRILEDHVAIFIREKVEGTGSASNLITGSTAGTVVISG